MRIRLPIISILTAALLFGCANSTARREHKPPQEAIALNDRAMELYMEAFSSETNFDSLLVLALEQIDAAIALDSLYVTAYGNKITLLTQLERHDEAMVVTRQLARLNCAAYIPLGWMYELRGDKDSAMVCYLEAVAAFDALLTTSPDSLPLIFDKHFALLFTGEDKSLVLEKLDKALENIPDRADMKAYGRLLIEEFDREEFLNEQNQEVKLREVREGVYITENR